MLHSVLETAHVLSAVLFLGAGLMTAYYKVRADRCGDLRVIAWCQREIVHADWLFTVPSGLALPVTGLWMALMYGIPILSGWVLVGILGFASAGIPWLPAAWLQLRMRKLADTALERGEPLPAAFHRANRTWLALGVPAFAVSIATVWVMVTKWSP